LRQFDNGPGTSGTARDVPFGRADRGAICLAVIEPSYHLRYVIIVNKIPVDRNFDSKAMADRENSSSPQRFSTPQEIDEILELLPPCVTLNVPDHVLSLWFPPGPENGLMEGPALERAQTFAQSCGCKFRYDSGTREGVFYK
jgi:hypothetical protein